MGEWGFGSSCVSRLLHEPSRLQGSSCTHQKLDFMRSIASMCMDVRILSIDGVGGWGGVSGQGGLLTSGSQQHQQQPQPQPQQS